MITVAGSKGGCGKSTTVATLARLWAPHKPVVIDTDRQQAVSKFKLPKSVRVLPCKPDDVAETVEVLAAGRLVLIDCPPDPNVSAQAIRAADLVILPTSAEYLELDATLRLLKALGGKYPARLLFTRYRGAQRAIVASTQQRLDGQVFTTRINRSIPVADAMEQRLTILDTAPESIAARQYIKLGKEILSYGN